MSTLFLDIVDVPPNDNDGVRIALLDEMKRFDADEIAWILMFSKRFWKANFESAALFFLLSTGRMI